MKTHCQHGYTIRDNVCPHTLCDGRTPPGELPVAVGETQLSVGVWADDTFGRVTPQRAALRVLREALELAEAAELVASNGESLAHEEKFCKEMADVAITLWRLAHTYGVNLQALVDEKMAVNRARKWQLDGRGGGQHVE